MGWRRASDCRMSTAANLQPYVAAPALPLKQNMDRADIPRIKSGAGSPGAGHADVLDPSCQAGLIGAARPVVIRRGVEFQNLTGSPDRHIPVPTGLRHQLAFATRPHSLSVDHVLQHCLVQRQVRDELAFSSSNCFSRFIGVGKRPSYFFFQLKSVAWLIPTRRQISATGIPSAPCFRMNAFCACENFEASIALRSSRPRAVTAENSSSERSSFAEADQGNDNPSVRTSGRRRKHLARVENAVRIEKPLHGHHQS